jgi:hypothetical protein
VLKKSVAHVVPVAMTAVVPVPLVALIVPHPVVHVVLQAPMPRRPMAVTNPLRLLVPKLLNPSLSAFAQSPRQLQQLTAKENKHVATRSPEIPQRAKGP